MARNVGYERSTGEETWLTPRGLIEAVTQANGELADVDPCTPCGEQPWPTAKRRFTVETDGLLQPGEATPWNPQDFYWVNPPYGPAIRPFMAALAQQNNGLALVFHRFDTKWWAETVTGKAAGFYFLRHRLAFCHPDGVAGGKSGGGSVLVAYGPRALKVLQTLSKNPEYPGSLLMPVR